MSHITLKNISKSFAQTSVLKSIDLDIQQGEFIVFVGPSGCGKSTLLRLICGLEELSDGEIYIDGQLVNDLSPSQRGIGMVFQSYALYPHMTVYENMAFGLKIKGIKKHEMKEHIYHTASMLKLMPLLGRKPKELSGGQRQRVAIGRALVREPNVILLDEPLSNLDASLRIHMRMELRELHQKQKSTMIYVTHDQVEAMTLADKIVVLNAGNIEQVGSPHELYSRPKNLFVAEFIGFPKMNLIPIDELNERMIQKPSLELLELSINKNIKTLGIRPEHLSLFNEPQENTIPAKLKHVEYLGGETLLYFCIGIGARIVVKVNEVKHTVFGQYWIGFSTQHIHLFDQLDERIDI